MINIFIGYDRNEQIAYHVLSQSILRNATRPIRITPLYQPNIKYVLRKTFQQYHKQTSLEC